ncbi:DNA polymerase zeta processivity subunit-like [Cyclospora cayetanensis]|uniref:DNA polymerase zeta processivity subunit-like n=1 Tax=Cyclospora cayetanensis TaxID=88456 RepID=A0A6P6S0W7_9EIME|nr:DNA polymerase zeta processivity subunit-like [Cyclospora cayetanensis]
MDSLSAEVVCSVIEAAMHSLLCVRKVYPEESFSRVRRFGQLVWQSNSKALTAYLREVCSSLVAPLRRGLLGAVCLRLQGPLGNPLEVYTFSFPSQPGVDGKVLSVCESFSAPAAAATAAAVPSYDAAESIQTFLSRIELISCWLPRPQQQQQQQQLLSFTVCAHAIGEVAYLAEAQAHVAGRACGPSMVAEELACAESLRTAQNFLCQWRRPFEQRKNCCGKASASFC